MVVTTAAGCVQSYFNTLDDELVIRILGHLGTTVCLGTAPEPRAALLPIEAPHINASACTQAPVIAPEISGEFMKPVVAESSSLLLHTPQLQAESATEAHMPQSSSVAGGSFSRR